MRFFRRMKLRRGGFIAIAVASLATLSATPALARPAVSAASSASALTGVARAAAGPSLAPRLPVAGPVIKPVPGAPIEDLPIATPADFAAQPPPPAQTFTPPADSNASVSSIPAHAVPVAPPSGPSAIQATGVTSAFNGQTQGNKGAPSDSGAAGGPSNVLEQVNGGVAVYSRAGALVYGPVTSSQWYGVPATDSQFDPHTIFDPYGYKFLTMMADGTKHSWMLSVTTTSDATSSRCTYTIDALNSGATSIDFPLMGVSPAYLMLTIRENGGGNRLVVLTLSQIESCQGAGTWVWSNVQNPGGGTADTLVPVLDYNTSDTYSYLLNSIGGGGSRVSMYKFNDSGSSPGGLVSANVSVPNYSPAPSAPQKGSSVVVETGNSAITQAVNYYSGTYATLTTGYGLSEAGVMWLQFNPDTQKLLSNGVYYNSALADFDPSITVESDGDAVYTYSLSGKTIYPSSAAIVMDINHKLLTNGYIHQGTYPSNVYRWGDFTTTYTDYSVNANAFWSASQDMADATHYGTVIAYGSA